jgi:hypothetical protein
MLLFAYTEKSHAMLGVPDHVPAATLIVPFFEVGIDSETHPQDTLPVILGLAPITVHYEVWDVFGNLTLLNGNFSVGTAETRAFSMRDIINATASAGQKTQLTDGPYYRGFVTFDVVTASTSLAPTNASYPFSSANFLEGFIYYTRLSQGSSNGLAMLAIEATPGGTSSFLHGFYRDTDDREEIDADGRYSGEQLTRGGSPGVNPSGVISRVHSRLYLEFTNNASTKVIVFTFPAGGFNLGTNFPGSIVYGRYDGAGSLVASGSYNLDRVVNVIELGPSATLTSGTLSLQNIPTNFETYAFSINSASPPDHPELTWDAIFESFIIP